MKNFKIIALVLFSISLTFKTYSQGHVSIHFGPSFPVLDFGSDNISDEDAGGADIGFNFGLQYTHPISDKGLSIFGGVDFSYNGLQKDATNDIKEIYESLGINNAEYKFYKYINIPITAGLNYTYQPEDKLGVFVNAGIALNFCKMTDMEMTYNGRLVSTEMDLAHSIGFKLGAGVLINQKVSISLDYLGLGIHEFQGMAKTIGYSEIIKGEGKIDLITLTLGVKF